MRYFDRFRVDPDDDIVWRDDARVAMTPKAFALLKCLLDRAGEVVTKDDILRDVWPDAHVDPANIKVLVREIRVALQDDVDRPRLVRTIAGRGYSFVAPVLDIPDAHPEASVPFVGRIEELAILEQAFEAAMGGDRRTIFVFGDHGIGKTALCESFIRHVSPRGSLRVMRCHSREQPQTEPCGALAAALGRSYRTRREIVTAIEERATHTPLVLLLEDAHWADSTTIEALIALGLGHEPAKLLVVVTARPLQLLAPAQYIRRAHLELLTHGRAQDMTVPTLDVRQVGRYLESRCGPHPLGDAVTATLHRVTEGNPLFLVTAVDSLIRKGRLVQDGDGWRLTLDPQGLEAEIPRSITAIITRQLDELDGDERQAIQAGAIAGMEFTVWSAARAADVDDSELEPVLEQIVRRRTLIARHGGANAEEESPRYSFKHAAYRDCVLQRIGPMITRRMHARLGLALDAVTPENDLRGAAELARHFEAAHDHARSARQLGLAARYALQRLAVRDAIALLKRAVDHASCAPGSPDDPTAVRLRVELGKAQLAAGDTADALVTFRRLEDPSVAFSYFDDQIAAIAGLMEASAYTSREEALSHARRIHDIASEERSDIPRAIHARAAAVKMCLDGWSRGLASQCVRAAALARHGHSPEAASVAISLMATDCFESRYKRVIATGSLVMPMLLDVGALSECMFGYYAMAYSLVQQARWSDARRTVDSAAVLAQRSGSPLHAATIRLFGAWLDLEMGRFDAAYRGSIMDRAFLQAHDWEAAAGLSLLLRARAALALRRTDEAVAELRTLHVRQIHTRAAMDWLTRIPFHLVSAAVALAQGDPLNAHAHAESAWKAAALTGERTWRSLASTMRAEVAMARGHTDDVTAHLSAARDEIARTSAPLAAARIDVVGAMFQRHASQPA